MRLTKNDMARVVVQALYALAELPATDEARVVRMAQRSSFETMVDRHKTALKVLSDVGTIYLPVDRPAPGQGWEISTGNEFMNVWVRPEGGKVTLGRPVQ